MIQNNVHGVLAFCHIHKIYRECEPIVDLSFVIPAGYILGVFGRPGSGKSTLCRLASLLERPTKGYIVCFGRNILKCSSYQRQEIRSKLGFVLDDQPLFLEDSIIANLVKSLAFKGFSRRTLFRKIEPLLEAFDLPLDSTSLLKMPVKNLSRSQKIKLLMIRALITDPAILILDQCLDALEYKVCSMFFDLTTELRKKGSSLLFTTGDLDLYNNIGNQIEWLGLKNR